MFSILLTDIFIPPMLFFTEILQQEFSWQKAEWVVDGIDKMPLLVIGLSCNFIW